MAREYPKANIVGLDLNPGALSLGNVNVMLADVQIDFHESNLYTAVPESLRRLESILL